MNDFILRRTPFVIINGRVMVKSSKDTRSCQEWITSYGYSNDDYINAIRGYIIPERLQFFTGKDYGCVPYINDVYLGTLIKWYMSHYGHKPRRVYNGVKVGDAGIAWPPIKKMDVGSTTVGIVGDAIELN